MQMRVPRRRLTMLPNPATVPGKVAPVLMREPKAACVYVYR